MNSMILPVVIAGGVGSRLWPLSRKMLPKQFIHFPQFEESLFQKTVQRADGIPNALPPLIVCNKSHQSLAVAQLKSIEVSEGGILLEPEGRNTAPAAAVAALLAKETDPNIIMLILPADHAIKEMSNFQLAIQKAEKLASQGYLVTFGIEPESPETGYGYIEKGNAIDATAGFEVLNFTEKPNKSIAESYFRDGHFFWNSGMFLFSAQSYLNELELYAPDIFEACTHSFKELKRANNLFEIPKLIFGKCRKDSIDYAVMEKTSRAAIIPLDVDWNDLGSWDSLAQLGPEDEHGNITIGDVQAVSARNSYIQSNNRFVAAVGVQDMVIVETSDAVLVAKKDSVQDVRKVVEELESADREEAVTPLKVEKPWGFYDSLAKGNGYQIKKIVVRPGEALSLQLHHHRAEHWVVIAGKGIVTRDDEEMTFSKNESIHIPQGVPHRLSNPFSDNLEIIEVQIGEYLGEDDIVRLEDKYGRQGGPDEVK